MALMAPMASVAPIARTAPMARLLKALLVAISGIRAIGARTRYKHTPYSAQAASMSQMTTMALMIEIPPTALMIVFASKAPMASEVLWFHVTNGLSGPNGSYCSNGSAGSTRFDGSYGAIGSRSNLSSTLRFQGSETLGC